MRDYGRVHSSFWTSATTRSMSEDGRALALYLLTSPHATIAGVFRLPDGYVCEDLQWEAKRVDEGFDELFVKGFAKRCATSKWVWVLRHLEWNALENPNQKKAAQRVALSIPSSCAWLPDFIEECASQIGLDANAFETLPQPFVNQEQQHQQQQDHQQSSSLRSDLSTPGGDDEGDIGLKKVKRQKPDDEEMIQDIADLWNQSALSLGLPTIKALPTQRVSAVRARIKDLPTYGFSDPLEGFGALIAKIRGSPFLLGTNGGWKADFDFAVTPKGFTKIMEGSYETQGKSGYANGRH